MILFPLLAALAFSPSPARAADAPDPFLWLEDVHSPKAMDWVKAQNARSLGELTGGPRYKKISAEARAIITAKDRLPMPSIANGWVYNFWQDAKHQHGLWRRTRPEQYELKNPKWDLILDIDRLNAEEKQDWVFKGASCLPPAHEDCLVRLSHGGGDSVVVREFDVARGTWVPGGFALPDSKTEIGWLDKGRVLVATDFGPGSMTTSSYPRIVKIWRRGLPLGSATTLFEGAAKDVGVGAWTMFQAEGAVTVVEDNTTFWTAKRWLLEPDESLKPIPFPDDANFQGVFKGELFAILRSPWKAGKAAFPAGALVALPLSGVWDAVPAQAAELVFAPAPFSSVLSVASSKDYLYVDTLENVQGRVLRASKSDAGWRLEPLPFPRLGMASLVAADDFSNAAYLQFESFLVPTTLYAYDAAGGAAPRPVKSLPARFDAKGLVVEQREAASKDGTKVPYFLVHRAGFKLDASHPTLLYGYGGFEIPMTPSYLSETGKLWLEPGEVYALANIRGGGEFGPRWHEAALKEHRQRAYDDFLAVAEDLVERKVTSPRRLGIMGGSNGGLLMGASVTQRPDLFHAVVCAVPLLDMLRYTKIAAGSSWIDEYGDPADPRMAEAIAKYSPYQNARPGVKYPEIFFVTSTRDDRVGPVHARKMAAKLESFGDQTLYWENIEGGHGAAADLDERVKMKALEFTYLFRNLAQ